MKLHYDFSEASIEKVQFTPSRSGLRVKDKTGNGYFGFLANSAYVDTMGKYSLLNMGFSDGHLQITAKLGELISEIGDFSVATYVCADRSTQLNADGNFLWCFSNSKDIMRDMNGCAQFSLKKMGYSITKAHYVAEKGMALSSRMERDQWVHVVYTQQGTTGKIYLNGELKETGTVEIPLKALGDVSYNFIGRSAYAADVYLKGLIADFRIYDKALTVKEVATLAGDLAGMNEALLEYKQKPIQLTATCNPLFTHKYTADPAALIHNDTFYIYAGQDTGDGGGYNIPNWVVFSSTDMKTWQEYPIPLASKDFKWSVGNSAWAAQVIERNGKFYWYVSTEHANVEGKHGKAIGVAVSDSPTGPFVDARGSALVTNNMTTKWTGISWDDIDPTVWIDEDGQAYIFWGNTQCYYAKLKENMIELDSEIMPIPLPNFVEAPWIHKRGEWFYLSYAAWFPEKICYAMSKSINGPWEYKGILNEVAGNSNTNHQSIVEYKGKWYFVYHNGSIPTKGGSYLRSVCIDYLHYNEDGTLKRIQMTSEGVDSIVE